MTNRESIATPLRLIGCAVLAQILFWFAFVPVFVEPPLEPPEFVGIDSFATAQLAAPDGEALAAGAFVDGAPGREMREAGYHAVRVTFSLDAVPREGLALLDNSGGDNSRHFVNGSLVHAPGGMTVDAPTYHSLREGIVHIPPGLLRAGENTLESIYTVSIGREVGLFPPLLGEYRAISEAFGWKAFLLTDFRLITTVIVWVVALFIGLAALRARDRDVPLWLFLAAAAWALHSLFYEWLAMPLAGAPRGLFYAATTMFLATAWAIFADAWSGKRLQYYRPAVWAVFAAGVAFSVWSLFVARGAFAFDRVETAVELVGIVLALATVARIAWHFATNRDERRYLEAAALILLASLMLFYLYAIVVDGRNLPYLTATQPLVLAILVAAFLARNFELFRSREQLNAELAGRLELRTAELELAHEREKRLLREQAHQDERRRIMRDMHDGMGSNLMAMMLAARRGSAEPEAVARGLQTVIDEMRLMIDSMDSVGESLGSALILFRERAQARVTEAGFAFEWDDRSEGKLPPLAPRAVLQVFRILQEAITNALKHSSGKRIAVTIRSDGIAIADDGEAFTGPRTGGRGLDNMEARARAIGGNFTIGREESETVARIELPADWSEE